ncbi:hypothetical protein Dda_7902 [Drechslerella dactyloides]|uniref:Uncharacterized protein n=1 Tax=Drechslerella dactyloides TaxID=74499 RepID=A0AAD6NG76_DREDA|nr:hypothetical protein Dda_7902 [Drechslerella dactyloides]
MVPRGIGVLSVTILILPTAVDTNLLTELDTRFRRNGLTMARSRPRSPPNQEKENFDSTSARRRYGCPLRGYSTLDGVEEESETETMIPGDTGLRARRSLRPASPLGDLRARRTGLGDNFQALRDASSRHNGRRQVPVDSKATTLNLDLRGRPRPETVVEDMDTAGDEIPDEHSDSASHTSIDSESENLEELEDDDIDELGDLSASDTSDTDEEEKDEEEGEEEEEEEEQPEETDTALRATSAQLLQGWRREKAAIIASSNGAVVANPAATTAVKPQRYRRPPSRFRVPRAVGKPATKLFRHLGLINGGGKPTGTAARAVHRWLRREDSLLLDQVALVPPRLQFPHVKRVYDAAFTTVRPRVLEYLRERHGESTWCLFFSEFVYFNPRHEGASGVCLFLMVSDDDVVGVTRAVEELVSGVRCGDEMAVIVRRGDPRLFGSYGLPRCDDEEEYEDAVTNEGTRGSGFFSNLFSRVPAAPVKKSQAPPTTSGKNGDKKDGKGKGKGNDIQPWSPSPTPPPGSPVNNVLKLHYDSRGRTTWEELEPFHYGLRWVTKLAVPAAEEGLNADFEIRPSIGSSLGNLNDSGSGTLAGYLTDPAGNCYAMSCHHVMKLDEDSVWPTPSDYLTGRTAVAPAQQDLYVAAKSHGHQIDGLVHEAVAAHLRGEDELAVQLSERGRKKIANHDVHVKLLERGGARFGKIVASAWRIAHTDEGPWLMDQVVVKPVAARIGTNAFTYTGRDNKEGKRYRLEARGWTDLPLGAEVLKLGRTTGLTKGTVIATNADIRLCVGTERTNDATRMTKRFWELKTGIITSGAGPWFSEPGDSGAWVLRSPSFEDMLSWDLRRRYSRAAADPIAAPVGGMMFGGADSVDGVSLTFYNPTRLVRRYLAKMMEGGEELVPGVGQALPDPAPLEGAWDAEEAWSRQSREAREGFEAFAERNFLAHHLQRFGESHIFREVGWREQLDERVKTVKDEQESQPITRLKTGRKTVSGDVRTRAQRKDTGGGAKRTGQPASGLEVQVPRTPYRWGTSEEAPDTPTPKHNGLSSRGPQRPAAATNTPPNLPTTTPRALPARQSKIPTRTPRTLPPSTLRTPVRRPQSTLISSVKKAISPLSPKVQDADSDDEVELAAAYSIIHNGRGSASGRFTSAPAISFFFSPGCAPTNATRIAGFPRWDTHPKLACWSSGGASKTDFSIGGERTGICNSNSLPFLPLPFPSPPTDAVTVRMRGMNTISSSSESFNSSSTVELTSCGCTSSSSADADSTGGVPPHFLLQRAQQVHRALRPLESVLEVLRDAAVGRGTFGAVAVRGGVAVFGRVGRVPEGGELVADDAGRVEWVRCEVRCRGRAVAADCPLYPSAAPRGAACYPVAEEAGEP